MVVPVIAMVRVTPDENVSGRKVGKKVATTVDLVLSVTKTDATFYLLFLI
jgi:hypothetical protein